MTELQTPTVPPDDAAGEVSGKAGELSDKVVEPGSESSVGVVGMVGQSRGKVVGAVGESSGKVVGAVGESRGNVVGAAGESGGKDLGAAGGSRGKVVGAVGESSGKVVGAVGESGGKDLGAVGGSSGTRGGEMGATVSGSSVMPGGPRPHPAWIVAGVGFVALLGAAAFRSVPSVLMDPLHAEFGWSHGTIGAAVSLNLLLYGLISPFAAALMDRFGIRKVVAGALLLVAAGSGLTVFMTQPWQLMMTWGLLVGVGVGSMSMPFVATITGRWFVAQRGLVTGILTAAGATGQLVFLPLVSMLAHAHGWRLPSLIVAGAALAVVPLVLLFIRDFPSDVGVTAYGAEQGSVVGLRTQAGAGASRALTVLAKIARTPGFWLLAGGFAVCGASTNGLVGTHFVSAAHDHGMPPTAAASLLAVVGIFDVAGTIASGWLTDRIDPRFLLIGYYTLRGLSLLILPSLLGPHTQPSLWVFIIFYGLDWVATVPPTVMLCRELFGNDGPVAFGWVFASHQIGSAVAATGAGVIRDVQGNYDLAWYLAGALCGIAAVMSAFVRRKSLAPNCVAA